MSRQRFDVRELGDQLILEQINKLNQTSAEVMADLLCRLAEVDRRRLFAGEGCSSLFSYAVEKLGCSEDEAARRIHAARAGGRFPVVFELVASGELTLTAVSRLSKHLTEANHLEVLAEAKGKTLREVDELIARLAPKPDVAPRLARLPEPRSMFPQVAVPAPAIGPVQSSTATSAGAASPAHTGTNTAAVPAPATATSTFTLSAPPTAVAEPPAAAGDPLAHRSDRGRIEPLSPERWSLRVTIGAAARRALRKAQDLSNPRRDEAAIVEQALIEYAERLESRKHATLLRRRKPGSAGRAAGGEPKAPGSGATVAGEMTAAVGHALPNSMEAEARTEAPSATDTELHVAKHVQGRRADDRNRGRRPSRAVRREVWERDGGRCTFKGTDGARCSATARLEYHHILAWALGGETTAAGLTLRCRAHNHHEAVVDFGAAHMAEAVERRRRGRPGRQAPPQPTQPAG